MIDVELREIITRELSHHIIRGLRIMPGVLHHRPILEGGRDRGEHNEVIIILTKVILGIYDGIVFSVWRSIPLTDTDVK